MSFLKKRHQGPPLEEIAVFISADFKIILNEHFGVQKISKNFVGWQFSRDFNKIGIKQGDFLVCVDQKDVRQEKNVEALFEKCFRKNINDDIFFSIVRKEYEDSMKHLGKKVRQFIS